MSGLSRVKKSDAEKKNETEVPLHERVRRLKVAIEARLCRRSRSDKRALDPIAGPIAQP